MAFHLLKAVLHIQYYLTQPMLSFNCQYLYLNWLAFTWSSHNKKSWTTLSYNILLIFSNKRQFYFTLHYMFYMKKMFFCFAEHKTLSHFYCHTGCTLLWGHCSSISQTGQERNLSHCSNSGIKGFIQDYSQGEIHSSSKHKTTLIVCLNILTF